MSSRREGERYREYFGVRKPNNTNNKKSRRPIERKDIQRFLFSTSECITHVTHLLVVPTARMDPLPYHPNYCRLVDAFFLFTVIASMALQGPTRICY